MPNTCPKCSASLDADAIFCSLCAAPVTHPCPGCGKSISSDAKFCKYCAFDLTAKDPLAHIEESSVYASAQIPSPEPPLRSDTLSPAPNNGPLGAPPSTTSKIRSGIGGWLILPAIGLVFSPILIIGGLLQNFKLWSESIGALELDYPGAHTAIIVQSIMGFGFLCFELYVAALFFTKRRSLTKMMIALLIVNLLLTIISGALYASVFRESIDGKEVWRAIILAGVWIPYFRFSKRVKTTFVT